MTSTPVAALHEYLPARGFASMWREGSAKGPAGFGPRHRNPGYELSWVREGFVTFALERAQDSITGTTGSSIVLTPGELNTPRAAGTFFQLMLSSEFLDEARSQLGARALPSTAFSFSARSRVSAISELIGRERRNLGDDDPLVKSLTDSLAMAIVRPEKIESRPLDAQIRRALEYLDAHFTERLSIEDVASATGLPRFVLMRRFKAQTGTSIYRHLQNVRLDRAAHALRTSETSVLDIALDCGFSDPGRFARAFLERFGAKPNAFRERSA